MATIPIYSPSLSGNEKKYVNECLDSTWISSNGRFISAFENKFAEYTGATYALTTCNGTVALHLALLALGIGKGDEVIVPTLTYVASVNSITYTGATPVFVDSLRTTWQMDPEDILRKITPHTRAILIVHLYGHPCEMEVIKRIALQHNLLIVEDCAEAFGSIYEGVHVGSFGDIAAYSFYGNKTITTGEGGMVTTNNQYIIEQARRLRGQGLAMGREYWHDIIGYNYRMTNICAAIGLAQLEQADLFLERKRIIARWYQDRLAGLPLGFHGEAENVVHSYWMCSILVEDPELRDPLREYLRKAGIETRPVFNPVHKMPMYAHDNSYYKIAEDLSRRGINLPSWPGLNQTQLERTCNTICEFYNINHLSR